VPASAAVSVLGLIGLVIKRSMRLGALEVKVETMWAFQMRRAVSETVASGMGTLNSPLKFSDLATASLEPIKQNLLDFWKTMPPGISDAEALLLIEARFGDDLLQYVCIPCKLSHGACLLLALTIAKQSTQFDLDPPRLGPISRAAALVSEFLKGRGNGSGANGPI
jgi:hypothetical protein